jgi:hypothetical protein
MRERHVDLGPAQERRTREDERHKPRMRDIGILFFALALSRKKALNSFAVGGIA